jgi:Tfp pilus assembly protein PilX
MRVPRVREESGFALIGALMLALAMLAFGIALAASSDTQSNLSRQERTREASFDLGEAALNAQVVQISRTWPVASASAMPSSCDPSSTDAKCPDAAAVSGGYTSQSGSQTDYGGTCPSSPTKPAWKTTVRDDTAGINQTHWTTAIDNNATYDVNGNSMLWIRSTGFVRCKEVSMVALVTRGVISLNFPNNVLTANWFATSNQGRKVIVDTLGTNAQGTDPASQPRDVAVRCSGLTDAQCKSYDASKGQVQPAGTVQTDTSGSTSALSPTQVQSLEGLAAAAGTLHSSGPPADCSSSNALLTSVGGAPVVYKGHCDITLTGGAINSAASPGVLVIEDGTLTLGGNAYFYGTIYMVNKQNSGYPTPVLTLQGNATVQGIVVIDGNGGAKLGSSKTNLVYDTRASTLLRGVSDVAVSKDTFRVLPRGTP